MIQACTTNSLPRRTATTTGFGTGRMPETDGAKSCYQSHQARPKPAQALTRWRRQSTHLIIVLLLIYRPRKDERLSWPSWLTCSGRFTHISGHPSGQSQKQGKFAGEILTFCHCATQPTNFGGIRKFCVNLWQTVKN